LSLRDVEDLLAERGITVSYEAIRYWCAKFGPAYARKLRRRQGRLGDTWFLDAVFVTIRGERTSMVDHRQAWKLPGCAQECDGLGGARHRALRDQPSRGLASADAAKREADAQVQVRGPSAAVLVHTRCRPESLQPGPAPTAIRGLPPASWSCLFGLERGGSCLKRTTSLPPITRTLRQRR